MADGAPARATRRKAQRSAKKSATRAKLPAKPARAKPRRPAPGEVFACDSPAVGERVAINGRGNYESVAGVVLGCRQREGGRRGSDFVVGRVASRGRVHGALRRQKPRETAIVPVRPSPAPAAPSRAPTRAPAAAGGPSLLTRESAPLPLPFQGGRAFHGSREAFRPVAELVPAGHVAELRTGALRGETSTPRLPLAPHGQHRELSIVPSRPPPPPRAAYVSERPSLREIDAISDYGKTLDALERAERTGLVSSTPFAIGRIPVEIDGAFVRILRDNVRSISDYVAVEESLLRLASEAVGRARRDHDARPSETFRFDYLLGRQWPWELTFEPPARPTRAILRLAPETPAASELVPRSHVDRMLAGALPSERAPRVAPPPPRAGETPDHIAFERLADRVMDAVRRIAEREVQERGVILANREAPAVEELVPPRTELTLSERLTLETRGDMLWRDLALEHAAPARRRETLAALVTYFAEERPGTLRPAIVSAWRLSRATAPDAIEARAEETLKRLGYYDWIASIPEGSGWRMVGAGNETMREQQKRIVGVLVEQSSLHRAEVIRWFGTKRVSADGENVRTLSPAAPPAAPAAPTVDPMWAKRALTTTLTEPQREHLLRLAAKDGRAEVRAADGWRKAVLDNLAGLLLVRIIPGGTTRRDPKTGIDVFTPSPDRVELTELGETRVARMRGPTANMKATAKAGETRQGRPLTPQEREALIVRARAEFAARGLPESNAEPLVDRIALGTWGDILDPANMHSRRIFEKLTGVKLPRTLTVTRAMFTGEPFPVAVDLAAPAPTLVPRSFPTGTGAANDRSALPPPPARIDYELAELDMPSDVDEKAARTAWFAFLRMSADTAHRRSAAEGERVLAFALERLRYAEVLFAKRPWVREFAPVIARLEALGKEWARPRTRPEAWRVDPSATHPGEFTVSEQHAGTWHELSAVFTRAEADAFIAQERVNWGLPPAFDRTRFGTGSPEEDERPKSTVTMRAIVEALAAKLGDPKWSPSQRAVFEAFVDGKRRNLVIEAVAGSGKTTTILEAVSLIAPSEDVLLAAFNKSIEKELRARLPASMFHVDVTTLAAFGYSILKRYWNARLLQRKGKYGDVLAQVRDLVVFNTGTNGEFIGGKDAIKVLKNIESIMELSESYVARTPAAILAVADDYNLFGSKQPGDAARWSYKGDSRTFTAQDIVTWVERAQAERLTEPVGPNYGLRSLRRDKRLRFAEDTYNDLTENGRKGFLSFADMAFPVAVNRDWKPEKLYDHVVVDEWQDMDAAQFEIVLRALKPGGRLIVVGDADQAIYRFRGADVDGMAKAKRVLDAVVLPLSDSYRVTQCAARFAQAVVPAFRVPDFAPEGVCEPCRAPGMVKMWGAGDVVISRLNRPLVPLAMIALKQGITPWILGEGNSVQAELLSIFRKILRDSGGQMDMPIAEFIKGVSRWDEGVVRELTSLVKERIRRWEEKNRKRWQDVDATIAENPDLMEHALVASALWNIERTGITQMPGVRTAGDVAEILAKLAPSEHDVEALTPDEYKQMLAERLVLTSVHRIKGGEAPRVFILTDTFKFGPNGWQKRQPTNPKDQRQEQNLWYVAATRAKYTLKPKGGGEMYFVRGIDALLGDAREYRNEEEE